MFCAALPEDDCRLILRYSAEYPAMWDHINGFLWLSPEIRPRQSLRFLKNLLRQEWLAYGLSEDEIDDLFAFKRKMINFDREYRPESLDALATRLRIWAYDVPNALFGQNRAGEPIPQDDHTALQKLAGRIVFADPRFGQNLRALNSLIRDDTLEDRWVKDIERLMLLEHFTDNPQPRSGHFEHLFEDFRPEWRTMDGMMLSYHFRYKHPEHKKAARA
ncbi:MAG: hypothetical protein KDI46_02010 [Alphaproteobacteria bacterium]|nr:hypothetical protein [Alphaproteobacteria bacterium]